MPQQTPSYRIHKPSGQAVVTLGGRDIYLGRYGSAESRAEYDRVVAEWLANGRQLLRPGEKPGDRLIVELILAFDKYAETHYSAASRELKGF